MLLNMNISSSSSSGGGSSSGVVAKKVYFSALSVLLNMNWSPCKESLRSNLFVSRKCVFPCTGTRIVLTYEGILLSVQIEK